MSDFKIRVHKIVAQIPRGRVMSYGQIAALCGSPSAARVVGQVAHYGPPDLPWQRVVRKDGGLAGGFPGGMKVQKKLLENEGVKVSDQFVIDSYNQLLFWPE